MSNDEERNDIKSKTTKGGAAQTATGEPDPWNKIYYATPGMSQPVGLNAEPIQYPPFGAPKKVVIIGGGMAGMKLAHTLTKHGVDFCLIEISKYLGGRIKYTRFENETIEEGANWINGTKEKKTGRENPIWTLAKQSGLKTQAVQDNSLCLDSNRMGKDVTDEFDDAWESLEDKADRLLQNLKRQNYKVQQDMSVKDSLASMGWHAGSDNVKNLVEWTLYDGEYGGFIERMSTFHNIYEEFTKEDFGKDEHYVYDKRGFNLIYKDMAEELQSISERYKTTWVNPMQENGPKGIFLNHRVTQINYWNNMVSVVATNNATGQAFMFNGDMIVCTTSIGVLKAGLIEFNPPLPQWKVDAYNQIEMANYVKIFMIFDTKWWSGHEYIFIANQRKGTYPMWEPIKSECGQNLIFTVCTGDESRRVERTDPEMIKNEITAHLYSVYGNKFSAEQLRPRAIHICKWDTDPRFMGSYSFLAARTFNEQPVHWQWLHAPVTPPPNPMNPYEVNNFKCPRLWFAGEAYDERYGGLLQGAYNSGWKVAIDLIKTFKGEAMHTKQMEEQFRRYEQEQYALMQQQYQQQQALFQQAYAPYQGLQQQYMAQPFGNYQEFYQQPYQAAYEGGQGEDEDVQDNEKCDGVFE